MIPDDNSKNVPIKQSHPTHESASTSSEKVEDMLPIQQGKGVKSSSPLGVSLVTEFVQFIKKYGVIGLAIGVVVGQAVNSLVQSIVNNMINPLIGLIVPSVGQLTDLTIGGIRYGQFLNDLINFLIILFVVFLSIKFFINRLLSDTEREKLNLK